MDKSGGSIKKIRGFLFTLVNKEFLIFLFFLLLSGIFWLLMTLNETYEMEFKIPVKVVNIPKNVVLTSDETDTAKVTLRDKGLVLLSYEYGDALRTININFKTYAKSGNSFVFPPSEIQRMLYPQLSASTKISAVKGDRIEYFYNYGECKKVPVVWSGHVVPEEVYFISQVEYYPDSVTVYATREKLDSITYIHTEQLNYTGFRDTLTVNCRPKAMKGIKVLPENLKIMFITDVLTEESIANIPIVGINMPEGKVLRTFPSKVTVNFVTGVRKFKTLSPKDFSVIVDYNEIKSHPSDKCVLYLRGVPHGVSRASLNIQQVDYLIENEE
ncbi:MAG: YbbR-like domain-containing protein [Prevotella sp.]|nr:YbbR-like domain-containing protein [Prevotella sp.]MDY4854151.1 YbbR-like domain-containing protein [Prevotella sp.]